MYDLWSIYRLQGWIKTVYLAFSRHTVSEFLTSDWQFQNFWQTNSDFLFLLVIYSFGTYVMPLVDSFRFPGRAEGPILAARQFQIFFGQTFTPDRLAIFSVQWPVFFEVDEGWQGWIPTVFSTCHQKYTVKSEGMPSNGASGWTAQGAQELIERKWTDTPCPVLEKVITALRYSQFI